MSETITIVKQSDKTIGNLICSYLIEDTSVYNTGAKYENRELTISITGDNPQQSLDDAIAKCKLDITSLINTI